MRLAVISFSGNVGKTTIARHLLAPRITDARIIAIESINAADSAEKAIRGREFAHLQEFLQVTDNVVVDIGASNVEDLLESMGRYHGSHEDFDCYVVPCVPALKQQQDTIATLLALAGQGIAAERVRLLFNMVQDVNALESEFGPVLSFLDRSPLATFSTECRLRTNEIYGLANSAGLALPVLAGDTTDYKRLIAACTDRAERIALAQRLAMRRLAIGVLPQLDACFEALKLPVEGLVS